ncbi:MAG: hypothetical protein K2X29_05485 [Candidatus Obscuribacterales bacterium]|nr:hypothetical protein [Candidatus Obscuribacterales bacterium]
MKAVVLAMDNGEVTDETIALCFHLETLKRLSDKTGIPVLNLLSFDAVEIQKMICIYKQMDGYRKQKSEERNSSFKHK